jgi:hypothetical protein
MASHKHNPGDSASVSSLTACIRFVRGRQLANREIQAREIGAAEGVPAIGLDGLSSTAYGPEAALTVLSAAGAAGLAYLGPVMLTILALLGILFIFLLANGRGLSEERWRLNCVASQPWRECKFARRRGIDD